MVPQSLHTVTMSTTINGPELFLIPFRKCSFIQLHILWTAASFSCCLPSSKEGLSRSVKGTCYLSTRSFFTFSSSGRRISASDLWRVSSIQWAGLSAQTPASPPLWRWRFFSGLRGSPSCPLQMTVLSVKHLTLKHHPQGRQEGGTPSCSTYHSGVLT